MSEIANPEARNVTSRDVTARNVTKRDDEIAENITWSSELISKLEKTTQASENIMQHAKAFHESHKLVESSRALSSAAADQVRRSRS